MLPTKPHHPDIHCDKYQDERCCNTCIENISFSIIYQACSQKNADQNFFLNFDPQCAVTADFWPRVKITADAAVVRLPVLNTFFLDVGQK